MSFTGKKTTLIKSERASVQFWYSKEIEQFYIVLLTVNNNDMLRYKYYNLPLYFNFSVLFAYNESEVLLLKNVYDKKQMEIPKKTGYKLISETSRY